MVRTVFLFLLLLACPAVAQVKVYYTFAQWDKLPNEQRAAYVAGLADTLAVLATVEATKRFAQHYDQCIRRNNMTSLQLANAMRDFARPLREMQNETMQGVLINYLVEACGAP
jgi:hypothetical protein